MIEIFIKIKSGRNFFKKLKRKIDIFTRIKNIFNFPKKKKHI